MKFLNDFEKSVTKMSGVGGSSQPPRYWHSFGNYVLNYTMAGDFRRGIAQGRVTGLTGPSGAGKSFILGNAIREAQKDGAYILVIDSENAFDDGFAEAIGIDTTDGYNYKSVTTIPQVSRVVSSFLKGYKSEYGDDPEAPKVMIGIDSLDMLMTETEEDNYSKGKTKGDQGQRNKQLKAMLRTFVQDIKELNVSIVITSQVYRNQDLLNGEGVWIVSDAVRYSMSQIALLTKLKLKGDGAGIYDGIRLRCQGFKTRFTKPFQTVEIEVPYESGMDPYSGLVEAAINAGVVIQSGAWYRLANEENKFQMKNFTSEIGDRILDQLEQLKELTLKANESEEEKEQNEETAKASRKKKASTE